jgi:hypothetical protein
VAKRNAKIAQKAGEKAERMARRGATANRAIKGNEQIMMSVGETESKEISTGGKSLGKYNRVYQKKNEFFTTYPADMVFDEIKAQLYEHFELKKEAISVDSKKWKMQVTFKETKPEIDSDEEEEEEQNKSEEETILATAM